MANTKADNPDKLSDWNNATAEQIAFLIAQKDREIERRDSLLKEIYTEVNQLRNQVKHLQAAANKTPENETYKRATSWVSKIVFAIQQEKRPLRSAEIITLLEKKEPFLASHYNKVQYFSAFLSQAVRYKRVLSYKLNGVRGYYYLLPEWMEAEGNVKEDFRSQML